MTNEDKLIADPCYLGLSSLDLLIHIILGIIIPLPVSKLLKSKR